MSLSLRRKHRMRQLPFGLVEYFILRCTKFVQVLFSHILIFERFISALVEISYKDAQQIMYKLIL